MTEQSKIVQRACQVLRSRVRFRTASVQLPGTQWPKNDAPTIREASRIYVESWIVPLLDAIERGDTRGLRNLILHGDKGEPITDKWPAS